MPTIYKQKRTAFVKQRDAVIVPKNMELFSYVPKRKKKQK